MISDETHFEKLVLSGFFSLYIVQCRGMLLVTAKHFGTSVRAVGPWARPEHRGLGSAHIAPLRWEFKVNAGSRMDTALGWTMAMGKILTLGSWCRPQAGMVQEAG
jgi:hypothetical protein